MGYIEKECEDKILKLRKTLYSFKQALKAWNARIDIYFKANSFMQCSYKYS